MGDAHPIPAEHPQDSGSEALARLVFDIPADETVSRPNLIAANRATAAGWTPAQPAAGGALAAAVVRYRAAVQAYYPTQGYGGNRYPRHDAPESRELRLAALDLDAALAAEPDTAPDAEALEAKVNRLALELGCHPVSIRRALANLKAEGLIAAAKSDASPAGREDKCSLCHGFGYWRGGRCPHCEGRGLEPPPPSGDRAADEAEIDWNGEPWASDRALCAHLRALDVHRPTEAGDAAMDAARVIERLHRTIAARSTQQGS